jgi:hypothetical protein
MERPQNSKVELPELEAEILSYCIFPEGFSTLVSECKTETKASVIADAIKNLIHYKLLVAVNAQNSLPWVYDSDQMQESTFKATARGVEWLGG